MLTTYTLKAKLAQSDKWTLYSLFFSISADDRDMKEHQYQLRAHQVSYQFMISKHLAHLNWQLNFQR